MEDRRMIAKTDAEVDDFQRAETNAKGIALLLDLTVQRIYQLEREGIIARTASGNYNISDTFCGYNFYKQTGVSLPPAQTQDSGFFMEISENTKVTASQLATILGITPTMVERLTIAGALSQSEPCNGIAKNLMIDAIAKLPLRSILLTHGETEERIQTAERRREAFLAAVKTADSMEPSISNWELFAIQDTFLAFLDTLPADIRGQIEEG